MRNVYLHGHLAKAYGEHFRLAVDTPGQAIRLLNANFPKFGEALRKGWYRLVVGNRLPEEECLPLDRLEMRLGKADFHLVPVLGGARGKGGVLKAVLGVALVGAAIFFSGGTLAAPLSGMAGGLPGLGALGGTYGHIAAFGLVTSLLGVSQLISPSQKSATGTGNQDSFALSGPLNMQEQGYPVPVVIGEVITGGIPVSSGIDVEDVPVGVALS